MFRLPVPFVANFWIAWLSLLPPAFSELLRCCLSGSESLTSPSDKITLYFQVVAIFFSRQLEIWFIGKGLSLVLVSQTVKKSPAVQEMRVQSLGQEDPLEKGMQPAPVFLPEESHGQRSLAGYSPFGLKELDTTEQLARARMRTHTLVREEVRQARLAERKVELQCKGSRAVHTGNSRAGRAPPIVLDQGKGLSLWHSDAGLTLDAPCPRESVPSCESAVSYLRAALLVAGEMGASVLGI